MNDDENFDYDIYMNNILIIKVIAFFKLHLIPMNWEQYLSVNKDFYGTLITYIGYILLYIGLLATMFYGRTRFKDLSKKLNNLKINRNSASVIIFLLSITL